MLRNPAVGGKAVDLLARVVRLEPGTTKNDDARILPLTGELFETLKMQYEIRNRHWPNCPWVFFRHGEKIKDFRGAWTEVCKQAGLVTAEDKPVRLFHDLRRTGVRNLIRAGVPERVAMAISGHKTRSVFDRYNIVNERDLHEVASELERYIEEQQARHDNDSLRTVAQDGHQGVGTLASKLLH